MNSSSQVQEGVQLVNRAGTSLKEIVSSVKEVAGIVADISRASDEQAGGIDQINRALVQMDEMTQQNSALVEENAVNVQTLDRLASATDEQVSVFKTVEFERAAVTIKKPVPAKPVSRVGAAAKPQAKAPLTRGPARAMQTQLAATVAKDEDWDEF